MPMMRMNIEETHLKNLFGYRKSEIDFITAIYAAEEYIEKIESKE